MGADKRCVPARVDWKDKRVACCCQAAALSFPALVQRRESAVVSYHGEFRLGMAFIRSTRHLDCAAQENTRNCELPWWRSGGFFRESWFWVRPSLDITDMIIVPSGFLEAVFGQRGYTVTIVPNIIDLSRFAARAPEDRRGCNDFPHIVVTRNLEAIYDNATAIRAFASVKENYPNARLTVAGAGPEKTCWKTSSVNWVCRMPFDSPGASITMR